MADALSRPPPAAVKPPPPSQRPSPHSRRRGLAGRGAGDTRTAHLAAIADAQPVDFSAMAAVQRTFPEVAEMMNSTTLQITTQRSATRRCSWTFRQGCSARSFNPT